MTITTDYTALRDKQQQVWSSGDYNKIAAITVPVSEHLVDHVGVEPGTRVLDVATGTGHVALAAARRVGRGRRHRLRARAARHRPPPRRPPRTSTIEFAEADAEHLPYADASFDVVLSAIGVMFTADHARAAQELVRVCRPGGRIGLVSWTPEGFVGGMLRDGRQARRAAARGAAGDPLGHRGRRRRAARRRGHRRRRPSPPP